LSIFAKLFLYLAQSCDETPCKNDGECENVDKETFKCNCTEAWTGETCEEKGEFSISNVATKIS
jgi:hypothetical protein